MFIQKKIKTITLLLLSLILMAVAGCSQASNETANSTADSSEKANTNPSNSDGKKQPITLKVFMRLQEGDVQFFNNMAETPAAKEIMKRTGINLEFIHPPVGQEAAQFNLMVTSGDLPDVIVGNFDAYKGGPGQAIKDKLIIDTKDLIDQYAPNLKKIMEADPQVAKMLKNDDGQLVGFGAQISNEMSIDEGNAYNGPMIRQDLLDQAGLPMPETVDDWYNVLKTFKEKFELEAPLSWSTSNPGSFLASAFNVPADGFYQEDNVVKFAPIEPGYRQYLETLHKWYSEGLIHKDYPTQNFNDHVVPMVQNGVVGAVGNMHLYWYASIKDEIQAGVKFVPAPIPVREKARNCTFETITAGMWIKAQSNILRRTISIRRKPSNCLTTSTLRKVNC
ncbi:extracellular solute-binding protein [Bacillus sp. FJAT-28004]|uniref:extracellular solute-binding protein n=1 Tax=Bacillus sp. FJAT-28004 TaxID=1679165 RepID=UPI0006B584A4|nr:extracellular solute-binding protein [Bacillus sp. FJAT-28004]